MNANRTVQSASPDVGSAPGSMGFACGGQSEVLKQVLCVIDKKVRNMEKKKVRTAVCTIELKFPKYTTVLATTVSLLNVLKTACCNLCFLLQSKLDDYQGRKNKGEGLNQDQLVSA